MPRNVKRLTKVTCIIDRGNRPSASARLLAKAIGGKCNIRGRPLNTRLPRIVWGCQVPKGHQLMLFEGADVSHPDILTREEAIEWNKKHRVVARTLLRASGGRGMTVLPSGSGDIPQAVLYTKYVPKKKEYRVHVIGTQIVLVQEKRKRRGVEANPEIRTHENGWVYCTSNLDVPDSVSSESIRAVDCLGLMFGAVDVIWNDKQQLAYVLEVNTAPGLSPSTAKIYADKLKEIYND